MSVRAQVTDDYPGLDLTQPTVVRPIGTRSRPADFSFPSFTAEEIAAAEVELGKRGQKHFAPLVYAVTERAKATWALVLGELNQRAGGQASMQCAVIAHHARSAHVCLELQGLLSLVAVAEEKETADRNLRNQGGLAVVATELLNKAYAAAEAEGKAKQAQLGPVGELMQTLGVASEGPESSPVSTPGVGAVGAPLPFNPNPNPALSAPLGPLSQPKPTPAAPGLNLDPESPSVFAAPLPKKPPRRKQEP